MFLLSFRNLITPTLIRFVFYVVVAIALLGGLVSLIQGFSWMRYYPALGMLLIIGSAVGPLLAILIARVGAELTLVVFMIRDELAWQREQRPAPIAAE